MTTNIAIIDDHHPLLHYTGTWNDAGAGEEFNGTTRWSSQQGSTVSFTFVGTSISVFGTTAAINPPQASLSFVIDNSIQGTYTPSGLTSDVHHETLYASPTLANGTHTIVITQTQAQANGVIFLDYLMYNTTSVDVQAFFVDDSDSRITYSPSWVQSGTEADFMHTSHASPGAGATLTLQFDGRGISFWGDIQNSSIGVVQSASISIDSGPSTSFVPQTQQGLSNNNLIFNSGDLPDTTHTIIVTAENNQPILADYFLIVPPAQAPSASSSASASASAASRSASSTSTPAPKKSTSIGEIVGPVVGGIVILALLLVFFLFFLPRRRRQQQKIYDSARPSLDGHGGPSAPAAVTPFSNFVNSGASIAAATGSASGSRPPLSSSQSHLYSVVSQSAGDVNERAASGSGSASGYDPYAETSVYGGSSASGAARPPAPAPLPRKLANEARYLSHHAPSSSGGSTSAAPAPAPHDADAPPMYTPAAGA